MHFKKLVALVLLLAAIQLLLICVLPSQASTATIRTDKTDYTPGETVAVMGTGFIPNAYYDIPVIRPDGTILKGDGSFTEGWDTVQADAAGNFTYYYMLDGIMGLYEVRVYASSWDGDLNQTPLATTTFTDAPAANLDQIRNGPADDPWDPAEWVNGNAGPQNAHYAEGYSIAYRVIMTDLPLSTDVSLTIGFDVKHGGRHAIDYLTSYDRIDTPGAPHYDVFGHYQEEIDPTTGTGFTEGVGVSTMLIPRPTNTQDYDGSDGGDIVTGMPGYSYDAIFSSEPYGLNMSLWGGTLTSITYLDEGDLTVDNSEAIMEINFTTTNTTAVLAWGGHIASRLDWGYDGSGDPRSAGGLSGSPYHMRLKDWNLGNLGNQDRSLKVTAVYVPGSITIIKDAIPDDSQTFSYIGNFTFSLVDDGVSGLNSTTFGGLSAGTYNVTELIPTGWDLTNIAIIETGDLDSTTSGSTAIVELNEGESVVVHYENTKLGVKAGRKWDDTNGDGVWDMGEPVLDGWTINLYNSTGDLVASDVTNSSGWYEFTGLTYDNYTVAEVIPDGWICTYPNSYGNHTFEAVPGFSDTDNNFGNFKLGVKGGYKWDDTNGDGVWDMGEPVLDGWTINLYNSTGDLVASDVTDGDGYYEFTGLTYDTYNVTEVLQAGWIQTYPAANHTFTATSGFNVTDNNFGNFKLGVKGGYKWDDTDGDGVWDMGEPVLDGWTINLYNSTDDLVGSDVTDGDGWYEFTGLTYDDYTVAEVLQAGWIQTYPAGGVHTFECVSGYNETDNNFGNQEQLEFLKQFTGSGALPGFDAPTSDTGSWPSVSSTVNELHTGPAIWWEVTYFVHVPEDTNGTHYYTLWDKWGGNLMVLASEPIDFVANPGKKGGGTLYLPGDIDFDIGYTGYAGYIGDGLVLNPTSGTANATLHTGDQQEETNPGRGRKNTKDGTSYDVDIQWLIGELGPGDTATLTIYVAPGINPGGILQFSSCGEYVINTGPRVRVYDDLNDNDYPDNDEFQYAWSWAHNQLTVNVEDPCCSSFTTAQEPITSSMNVIGVAMATLIALASFAKRKFNVFEKFRKTIKSKIKKV